MTRIYSVARYDVNTKRFICQILDISNGSIQCEISALYVGFFVKSVDCQNFGMPAHFVSVEISTFLSRCQSFLTGRQVCFDFESSERF